MCQHCKYVEGTAGERGRMEGETPEGSKRYKARAEVPCCWCYAESNARRRLQGDYLVCVALKGNCTLSKWELNKIESYDGNDLFLTFKSTQAIFSLFSHPSKDFFVSRNIPHLEVQEAAARKQLTSGIAL